MGELVFEELDGASLFGFQFRVEPVTPGRRAILRVETPLGNPQVDARIELSAHSPWLNPEVREPLPLFVHEAYEFTPPAVPVLALEETTAEKLAAFRRRSLLRDLYDLAWISRIPFNEAVVRKLTYLKVYVDVVEDTLGTPPFYPATDIIGREISEFPAEDIGLLSGQLNMVQWLQRVSTRFAFLTAPTPDESRWARCNQRDSYNVSEEIRALRN